MAPSATRVRAQASVMASGLRDDVSPEYTRFMRRGEDARLHGRFLYPNGEFKMDANNGDEAHYLLRKILAFEAPDLPSNHPWI